MASGGSDWGNVIQQGFGLLGSLAGAIWPTETLTPQQVAEANTKAALANAQAAQANAQNTNQLNLSWTGWLQRNFWWVIPLVALVGFLFFKMFTKKKKRRY